MKELREEELLKIERLHNIYCSEKPDFISKFDNFTELQRLKEVGQNCGDDYLNERCHYLDYFMI